MRGGSAVVEGRGFVFIIRHADSLSKTSATLLLTGRAHIHNSHLINPEPQILQLQPLNPKPSSRQFIQSCLSSGDMHPALCTILPCTSGIRHSSPLALQLMGSLQSCLPTPPPACGSSHRCQQKQHQHQQRQRRWRRRWRRRQQQQLPFQSQNRTL